MQSKTEILVVEDDDVNRYLCETLLRKEGYEVTSVASFQDARIALEKRNYPLVILDLNLPDGDGLGLARSFSNELSRKFLIMTARDAAQERYLGFEAGAADYLIKPFHPGELLHRVRNLLPETKKQDHLVFGEWTINLSSRTLVDQGGNAVSLTRGEFDLLATLAASGGRVISRDTLLEEISRDAVNASTRTVDVLVSRIRKKIEPNPASPRYVLTVPSLGYRLGETV